MVTPPWRFLALAHGSYAVFETAAGLVLLDRRAAHERVWFERLRDQFRSGAVPSQRLLLPVPLELDPVAAALLLDRLPEALRAELHPVIGAALGLGAEAGREALRGTPVKVAVAQPRR